MWLICDRIINYFRMFTLKWVELDSDNSFTLSPDMCNAYLDNYLSIYVQDEKHIILATVISGEPLAWITCDSSQLDNLISILKGFRDRIK